MLVGSMAFLLSISDLSTGRERIASLCFPYAYWYLRWFSDDAVFKLILFAQFPLYGVLCALAYRWAFGRKAAAWIVFLHVAIAISYRWLSTIEGQYLLQPFA
jgi:hypothetical protein